MGRETHMWALSRFFTLRPLATGQRARRLVRAAENKENINIRDSLHDIKHSSQTYRLCFTSVNFFSVVELIPQTDAHLVASVENKSALALSQLLGGGVRSDLRFGHFGRRPPPLSRPRHGQR